MMKDLSESIAKENSTDTIVQVENVKFSLGELQQLFQAFHNKMDEIKKQGTGQQWFFKLHYLSTHLNLPVPLNKRLHIR